MLLRDDIAALLGRPENGANPLAAYLGACLKAFDIDSWRRALANRAKWEKDGCPKR